MFLVLLLTNLVLFADAQNPTDTIICPDNLFMNFTRNGLWCYSLQPDFSNFQSARLYCNLFGYDLVSIHDEKENNFVAGLADELLIGLYSEGHNKFEWTDETALDYTNFAGDFIASAGSCVKLVAGVWKNADCTAKYKAACKAKAYDYSTTAVDKCPDENAVYKNYGQIYSPGYPSDYNASNGHLNCKYRLQGIEGDTIVLEVDSDFNRDRCGTMRIYEGWEESDDKLLGFIHDWEFVPITTNNSNLMLIVFDGCQSGNWKAIWYSDKSKTDKPDPSATPGAPPTPHHNSDACPQKTDYSDAGLITSPGFPFAYDANIECDFTGNLWECVPPSSDMSCKISFQLWVKELNLGPDDWIDVIDTRTNTVVETTRENIEEGSTVDCPYNFTVRFHSGNDYGLFNHWAINVMQVAYEWD